jgi:hypothetical protein
VAELRLAGFNRDIFFKGGLNYELFDLACLPFFEPKPGTLFEPRGEPLLYESADDRSVVLTQPERFRLAIAQRWQFPARPQNPAWDYVLYLDDAQIGIPQFWDLCLAIRPYKGRDEALKEIRRYQDS